MTAMRVTGEDQYLIKSSRSWNAHE